MSEIHHFAAADLVVGAANFTPTTSMTETASSEPYERRVWRIAMSLDPGFTWPVTARTSNDRETKAAKPARTKRQRKPTLIGIAKQAAKAAITVARYELKPDGTVIVHTAGEADSGKPGNDLDKWLETRRAY